MKTPINLSSNLFEKTISKTIESCFRLYHEHDKTNFDLLKSDGNVYLQLSDKSILAFYPYSESFTVYAEYLNELPEKIINISEIKYFKNKLGKRIKDYNYLFQKNKIPYGIELILSNNQKIKIEYSSENDITFDSLIIK